MIKKQFKNKIVKLVAVSFGLSTMSCGASIQEYAIFANSGQRYYTALDTLFTSSGEIIVDSNSEVLIRNNIARQIAITQVINKNKPEEIVALIDELERQQKNISETCEKDINDGDLDLLIIQASNINIKASEFVELRQSSLDELKSRVQNASQELRKEEYECLTKLDKIWLTNLNDVRMHNKLLRRYFNSLEALATSDAPTSVQAAIQEIFSQVENIGSSIRASPLFVESGVPDATSQVAGLIVRAKIKKILKEELEKRKDAISLELNTQTELLEFLGNKLSNELEIIQESQERRYVRTPYLNNQITGRVAEDTWIKDRRDIRLLQLQIEGLQEAKNASAELEKAFKELLSDEFTIARANVLLDRVEQFLQIAEALSRELE